MASKLSKERTMKIERVEREPKGVELGALKPGEGFRWSRSESLAAVRLRDIDGVGLGRALYAYEGDIITVYSTSPASIVYPPAQPEPVRFDELECGDVFEYGGKLYMKAREFFPEELEKAHNAVLLANYPPFSAGDSCPFRPDTLVIPRRATLRVEV
jgi:hypothetical protein